MSPHLTRRTRLLSAVVALGLLSSACGGDDTEPDEGPAVLSQESADGALLTLDDVGEGFVDNTQPDDEEESGLGCLSGIQQLSDLDAATKAKANFDLEGDSSLRSVLSGVSSFEDDETITEALDEFGATIEACDEVSVSDPSGFKIALEVTPLEGGEIGDVDDQVRFTATGVVAPTQAQTYPYDLTFVASRIDNHLSVVGILDIGVPGEDSITELTETAIERLNDATD